jgi:hypothetical protein
MRGRGKEMKRGVTVMVFVIRYKKRSSLVKEMVSSLLSFSRDSDS